MNILGAITIVLQMLLASNIQRLSLKVEAFLDCKGGRDFQRMSGEFDGTYAACALGIRVEQHEDWGCSAEKHPT